MRGFTKTGKPRYYFAREPKGEVLNEIPPGFKISESVNGVVSLMQDRPSPSAALDVFDYEPLEADGPLRGLDNAYLFPLAAGATKETQDATGRMAVENAIPVLQGKKPLYVVNPEVLG